LEEKRGGFASIHGSHRKKRFGKNEEGNIDARDAPLAYRTRGGKTPV